MMEQMKVGYGVMLQGFGHALDYGEKSADRLMGKLKSLPMLHHLLCLK